MSAAVEMPADPGAVEEAGEALRSACGQDGDAAWRLAWRWASAAADDSWSQEQIEALAERAMDAGGYARAAEGASAPPAVEQAPGEPAPTREPAQRVAPTAPPPLPAETAARLAALTAEVEQAEPQVATASAERWDPDARPVVAGVVEAAEWRDLRNRGGPVRVLTLRSADAGAVEVWGSWQQLAALLRQEELAHGRPIQADDLVAISSRGKGRIEGGRNPVRLFSVAVEWAADRG